MNFVDEDVPIDSICGLRPKVWLSVGTGFVREDVKSLILEQGRGLVGESILTLQEICIRIVKAEKDSLLGPSARQEVLRLLFSEPRILAQMEELKRAKRQRNFLRRLDLAIQSGRMAFAHPQEEEVYEERLQQSGVENRLRGELRALSGAWEVWMSVSGKQDLPMLIRAATDTLRNGWPPHLNRPQEIWSLSVETPESLEREFWETLGQILPVKQIHSVRASASASLNSHSNLNSNSNLGKHFEWQRWHTLDDAAETLMDQLSLVSNRSEWQDHAVLIPDIPSIRRSLRRAMESRGFPPADTRDPTRLRWEEAVKWAILPMDLVARNFERQRVISWLRDRRAEPEFSIWVVEINSRGIRNGLASYAGGNLALIHTHLSDLNLQFSGRKTCAELSELHLKSLKTRIGSNPEYFWLQSFFEQTWAAFSADMTRVGHADKKAPLLFWLERLQARLSEATPPIERLKPQQGIPIYRLQQGPVKKAKRLFVFGMPSQWLSGEGTGNYWFSERDREILATEFAVRSCVQVREERIRILKAWISGADEIVFLDSQYSPDGREKESILPILKELELHLNKLNELNDLNEVNDPLPDVPEEKGAHPRFSKSYGAVRPTPPQTIELPALPRGPSGANPEITATALDRYSRCPFQALGYHRWNLRDVREPDTELWPDVRGNILHEAVRLLLAAKNADGHFALTPREALDLAWKSKRPKGLLKSYRIERYVKSRLNLTLEVFCEKEREYLRKSQARPVSLEESNFRLDYTHFAVVGQPDRIDGHRDGLFILDYKSSGTVPHGAEMVERGYRLQLPFYALAAQRVYSQPVIGVQFVELDKKGGRKSGIFFKEFNGKEPGKLTQVRSNSKSLVPMAPGDAWATLEKHLVRDAEGFVAGKFEARPRVPKREKECSSCALGDLCGFRRLITLEGEEDAAHA